MKLSWVVVATTRWGNCDPQVDTLSGFGDDVKETANDIQDKNTDYKQSWDIELSALTADGADNVRDKGYLDPGYWCDQRHFHETGDEFILDTVDFRHNGDMERRWTQFAHHRPLGPFNRIVGGENVQKNAWRWIGYFYGCGSTLIASDWALTAAHCCTIPAWYFKGKELCFGRDERNIPVADEQCAGIAELIQHPNYDRSETVLNDICLIRLSRKVDYNEIVQPACLPEQGHSLSMSDVDNTSCFVAGWGYREEGIQSSLPIILQDATANVLTNETCDEAYTDITISGQLVHYFRSTEMSCFGHLDGSMDACQGDSGGPLICLERSETHDNHVNPVLRGVVSWGEGCARASKPGVYARLSNYIDWIQDTIREKSGTTNQNCASPEKLLKISSNVIIDCSWEECRVTCKDEGYIPTHNTLRCFENKRNYYPVKSGSRIECAPDPGPGNNLFTACGAVTSAYDIDISRINVKCKKMKCVISSKDKDFVPNVSAIKCLRGLRYSFDGPEIKLHPAGSVTRACGPFFDYFPKAVDAGIKARCTANACFLSKPGSFIIAPYQKIACQRKMWQVAKVQIVLDPDWRALSFDEYSEFDVFNTNKNGEKSTSLSISCGRSGTIWDLIEGKVDASFAPGSGPKPICVNNKTSTKSDCYFYCPSGNGNPVKINVKISCKVKAGIWSPLTAKSLEKLKC